ncbi:hypothetical protein QUA40_05755 [Microcoleus sp. Pol11C3]|uniref:hypothetical protein n=1 Tax=Microcoleus sp. Pol11C3 TaxID=3055390 RepID=UPI002FD5ABA6
MLSRKLAIELVKSSIDAIADKKNFRLTIICALRSLLTFPNLTTKQTILAGII